MHTSFQKRIFWNMEDYHESIRHHHQIPSCRQHSQHSHEENRPKFKTAQEADPAGPAPAAQDDDEERLRVSTLGTWDTGLRQGGHVLRYDGSLSFLDIGLDDLCLATDILGSTT